jgi:hypothetical protein
MGRGRGRRTPESTDDFWAITKDIRESMGDQHQQVRIEAACRERERRRSFSPDFQQFSRDRLRQFGREFQQFEDSPSDSSSSSSSMVTPTPSPIKPAASRKTGLKATADILK